MKPKIIGTRFGSINIGGERYERDVVIRLSGAVKKRRKRLSKAVYGTAHVVSLDEAKHVYQKGAERLIVGTGHGGQLTLSEEAADYLRRKRCRVDLWPTPRAADEWNEAKGAVIALFHVTC